MCIHNRTNTPIQMEGNFYCSPRPFFTISNIKVTWHSMLSSSSQPGFIVCSVYFHQAHFSPLTSQMTSAAVHNSPLSRCHYTQHCLLTTSKKITAFLGARTRTPFLYLQVVHLHLDISVSFPE